MTIDSQIFVLILSSVIFWSFVGFLIFCFCCDGDCCYCCNYCFEVIPEIVIEEKKDIEEVIELNKVYEKKDIEEVIELNKVYENNDIIPRGKSLIEMTDIIYI